MRLLILTQAIDTNDPVLGFFHDWIKSFASKCERIDAIGLRVGEYALPENVHVHSLGKGSGVGKVGYLINFFRLVWQLRHQYDAVFVHMNPEYVVLAGLLWRILRKRMVLWRNHAHGGVIISVACALAHVVCYTSDHAFVAKYRNAVRMPVGIDIDAYSIPHMAARGTVLALGRFDPVKKMDVLLAAIDRLGGDVRLDVYGLPTKGREMYMDDLRKRYAHLEERGLVRYMGNAPHRDTPKIYASHDIFVNLTPTGSFDKTIFEAMASGCLVVTTNPEFGNIINPKLFSGSVDAPSVAAAIGNARHLSDTDSTLERKKLRSHAAAHSLQATVDGIKRLLSSAEDR